MPYNIYKDDELIGTTEDKTYTVENLDPNTDYTFSVTETIGEKESEKATVNVKTKPIDVTSVDLTPNTNNLEVDDTRQLNVAIEPSNATNQDASYASSDDAVATVSGSGLVTAVAEGTATITVTVDSKTDTATVNVTEPETEPEPDPDPEEGDD